MRETGSAVVLGHHDTKPIAGKPDERAKPQRASGGGIFSIADAPIHAELVGPGSRTILTPSHYKFSTAPDPFVIQLEADDPKRPTWVRLRGEDTTAAIVAGTISLPPMGHSPREKGPIELPPSGGWIGSVLRLPEGLDLRRSASRRRSAPVGSGRFVRQTAPTERISSTLHAARTPRRSGPSYSRRWPRRSGAFQVLASKRASAPNDRQPQGYCLYAHRDSLFHRGDSYSIFYSGSRFDGLREKTTGASESNRRKNLRIDRRVNGSACAVGATAGRACVDAWQVSPRVSYVRAVGDCPAKHPSGGIGVFRRARLGQRLPSFRRHGQEMDFFREAECLGCLVDRAAATG